MTFDWGLGWKLKGIWLAFGAVNLFLCVLYVVSIFITDWDK